jgi:hypothetical protein
MTTGEAQRLPEPLDVEPLLLPEPLILSDELRPALPASSWPGVVLPRAPEAPLESLPASPLHLPLEELLGFEREPAVLPWSWPACARCMQSWRSCLPDRFLHVCIASAVLPLVSLLAWPELCPPTLESWLDGRVDGVVRSVGCVGGVEGEAAVPGALVED